MVFFVLIHSPLVGPLTWRGVARVLRAEGARAIVPALRTSSGSLEPYWKQHARSIVDTLGRIPSADTPVLVAHSGAGALLPAVRAELGRPVAGYIFVDAGIPEDGRSRLDRFSVEEAAQFRAATVGGLIPTWTEDDLHDVIPDDGLRKRFVAELHPLPVALYEESIPVFSGWPDAPCGYFSLTGEAVYGPDIARARREGWALEELPGGHFHMLVDPEAVADVLLSLMRKGGMT